jgi:LAO/AO transport system kinase
MELTEGLLAGDRRSLARVISHVENGAPDAPSLLAALYPHTGRGHVIGVTGAPGTGKSTLVNALARAFRDAGETVGILAIDPTSPFSGGAILGDRVRMRDLVGDPGVFIRSMATRGNLGGLARSTHEAIQVLDAAGFSRILVETVGVGQAEVDIASAAHTTIVVEAPGLGDEVQTMKAGILEIADVLVVNKADREGADQAVMALQTMRGAAPYGGLHEVEHSEDPLSRRDWRGEGLEPGPKVATGQDGLQANGSWLPPIVKTVATIGEGVEALRGRIEEHRTYLHASGSYAERETTRAASILDQVLCQQLKTALTARLSDGQLARLVTAVANRELDPYSAAQQLLALHLEE